MFRFVDNQCARGSFAPDRRDDDGRKTAVSVCVRVYAPGRSMEILSSNYWAVTRRTRASG